MNNTTLTAREYADRLGCSYRRVLTLIQLGRIPAATKRGGVWWIPTATPDPRDQRYVRSRRPAGDQQATGDTHNE